MSISESIKATLAELPKEPGVYRYIGRAEVVLYVGKAKNLRNRVRSYFQDSRPKNQRLTLMISQIERIEFTVVATEKESLILESNLIHSLQPKYNVLLKDDRSYLFVRRTQDPIPGFFTVRKRFDPRSRYFGPYTRKMGISQTLRTLRTIFPYCQERFPQQKPCSYVGIKLCDGVCIGSEDRAEYTSKIASIESILEGDLSPAKAFINRRIEDAVGIENYELAALWRNRMATLEETIGTQKAIMPYEQDIDIIALVYRIEEDGLVLGSICVQQVRTGRIVNVNNFMLTGTDVESENLSLQFLQKYCVNRSETVASTKDAIVSAAYIGEEEQIQKIQIPARDIDTLKEITGQKIYTNNIFDHNKEEIKGLLDQGVINARIYLERHKLGQRLSILEENNLFGYLVEIQNILQLQRIPRRVECYDISHLSGTYVYGSMVVFIDGRPVKKHYRLFKTKQQNNDFENHHEVLKRRFERALELSQREDYERTAYDAAWDLPDLVIVDGGKGQLSADEHVINEFRDRFEALGLDFPVEICSLAKREEEIFVPDMESITHTDRGSEGGILLKGGAKFLVQRVRDEAHRFAISNNRKARLNSAHKSELDKVDGVGSKKKVLLLTTFGSPKGVVEAIEANPELVGELVGNKTLDNLRAHFGVLPPTQQRI